MQDASSFLFCFFHHETFEINDANNTGCITEHNNMQRQMVHLKVTSDNIVCETNIYLKQVLAKQKWRVTVLLLYRYHFYLLLYKDLLLSYLA